MAWGNDRGSWNAQDTDQGKNQARERSRSRAPSADGQLETAATKDPSEVVDSALDTLRKMRQAARKAGGVMMSTMRSAAATIGLLNVMGVVALLRTCATVAIPIALSLGPGTRTKNGQPRLTDRDHGVGQ